MSDDWSDATFDIHFRQRPSNSQPAFASMLIKVADTGALPVLAATDDGRRYWLKWPGNPHGNRSLVNELVVARIGELLGAPVRPARLVTVDGDLTEGFFAGGHSLPGGTYFGSELLTNVEETTEIVRVKRDGNAERLPRFLALWSLCLGQDLQLLYHLSKDDQVWSIDHGLWFDNYEADWNVDLLNSAVDEHWSWPEDEKPIGLDATALVAAADSLSNLTVETLARIVGEVPPEWGVPDVELRALATFVHSRRDLIDSQLRASAGHYS